MRGARRAFASRANGRLSKGPRTAAGTMRRARAALRHGLNLPVVNDTEVPAEIDALAREIATSATGGHVDGAVDDTCHAAAARIAEAMLDLRRIRLAKRPFAAALEADPANAATLRMLERLDRYERRALSRRKFAIREFAAGRFGKTS